MSPENQTVKEQKKPMKSTTRIATAVCFGLIASSLIAEEKPTPPPDPGAPPAAIAAWRAMRVGMFIHWGPVTLTEKEISWSLRSDRRWTGEPGKIEGDTPQDVYENLYKKFDPKLLNGDEWVQTAKDMGARYLVFTTKHHDGFCEWDTKLTDYKITNPESPYHKDVVKQLSDACHRGGVAWGIYYSPPDAHHPDFRLEGRHDRYIKYMQGQLKELLSNYGRTDVLFFDQQGKDMSTQLWDSEETYRICRALQPNIIINNRLSLLGDNDTPENEIGHFNYDRPWESNCTLEKQWSWRSKQDIRPLDECLRMLICTVINDGNFLFNFGPMPDGRMDPHQVVRAKEIGNWLKKYGQSIYSTRGGPFLAPDENARGQDGYYGNFQLAGGKWWGGSTRNGKTVYLHILRWPSDTIEFPALPRKIIASSVLTGGSVKVVQTAKGFSVTVPAKGRDPLDTIVKLELDGSAMDLPVITSLSGSITRGKTATASSEWKEPGKDHSAAMAVDGNSPTFWGADAADAKTNSWLEVDLGKPETFSSVQIDEASGKRIEEFSVQAWKNEAWVPLTSGTAIGLNWKADFPPATAQRVRLHITKASDNPCISEFQLYPETQSALPK
jgi:alpha-L-fucosidase